jgi:hypothetical protein
MILFMPFARAHCSIRVSSAAHNSAVLQGVEVTETSGLFTLLPVVAVIDDAHGSSHRAGHVICQQLQGITIGKCGVVSGVEVTPFLEINGRYPVFPVAMDGLRKMDKNLALFATGNLFDSE